MGPFQELLKEKAEYCEHLLKMRLKSQATFKEGDAAMENLTSLLADWKFLFGLVLWAMIWCACWLPKASCPCRKLSLEMKEKTIDACKKAVGQYWTTAIMVMGLDLMALSLLQHTHGLGFFGLFLLVFLNAIFTLVMFHRHGELQTESELPIESFYEDVWGNLVQTVVLFVVQTVLVLYLIYWSFVNYENSDNCTYGFWVTAYLVQMGAIFKRGKFSQLGPTWKVEQFWTIVRSNHRVKFVRKIKEDEEMEVAKNPCEMWARHFMGFLVNMFYRDLIAFLTPLLLIQSEDAKDFVQNCFAIAFVSQLDDIEGNLTIRLKEPTDEGEPTDMHCLQGCWEKMRGVGGLLWQMFGKNSEDAPLAEHLVKAGEEEGEQTVVLRGDVR